MMKKVLIYIFSALFVLNASAQKPVPGAVQNKSIRIYNIYIHVGNGTVIENGEVAFIAGKIAAVSASGAGEGKVTYEINIDGGGKHLYPGFILTNSTIGLREVDAVRATLDYDESGDITPEVRAISTYNTDSKIIPTIRFNGVLIAQSTPRGGLISGQSSIVQLDAWNWEDASIKEEDGLHVNWPNRNKTIHANQKDMDEYTLKKERNVQINKIKDMFERALIYMNETTHAEYNGRCEALKGLFTGSKTLYIHVNTERDIIESVTWFETLGIKKIVVVGGYEAYKIPEFMKQHNISIILDRMHALPHTEDDDVKLPYKMPKLLWDAGINFTFSHTGEMEVMGSRNIPFNAGTAVAYGLEKEQAVQILTLNAARILGIDQQLGSIEVGKEATFFICDGDALDMRTNNIALAYINGRQIELENSQYYLYKMYMDKYGLKMK